MAHEHLTRTSLAEDDAASYLGFTRSALRSWRRLGRGPAYIRAVRSIRYKLTDLDAWLDAHRVDTTQSRQGAA